MTPSEFKSWFQGYTEAHDGLPSEAQWARIKARVAEIDGRAITEHVWVNRYVPHYYPNYLGTPYILCGSGGPIGVATGSTGTANLNLTTNSLNAVGRTSMGYFDSHAVMLCLGRAEAQQFNS